MSYCHDRKILHRDLKPENILISDPKQKDFDIKVIDFGASVYHSPSKKLTDKFGTVYYIAPEVLKGRVLDKSDVWSLGVIMYILLSGEPPFNASED